jgi:hypothetical protein
MNSIEITPPSKPITHFTTSEPFGGVELWMGKLFIAKSKDTSLEFFEDNPILPLHLVHGRKIELKFPNGHVGAWPVITPNTIDVVITSNVANVEANTLYIESYESDTIDVPVTNFDGKKNTLVFAGGICGLKSWDWN